MRILLLGANGQVGSELRRSLAPMGQLEAWDRDEVDFEDLDGLRAALRHYAPEVIVNAAAYTAVDQAESEPDKARRINAEAPGLLAEEAKRLDAWLIHYSTDYVFDGTKAGPYRETDRPNPLSVYGKTKLQGEEAVQGSGCRYLIFRTSWVIGVHGHNFIKTILRLASERDSLNVVSDQRGAPTAAELIAEVTALAVAKSTREGAPSGIYHLAPTGHTNWHELARQVVSRAQHNDLSLCLRAEHIAAITTEDYPTPAQRPKNSMLDTSLLVKTFGVKLPDWKIHVARVVDQIIMQAEVTT